MPRAAHSARLGVVLLLAGCGEAELRTVDGVLTVTPSRVDYGLVAVGVPARRDLELANEGEQALTWTSRGASPALRSVPAEGRLDPGERARVALELLGAEPARLDAAVVFDTNSARTPSVPVAVTATLAPSILSAQPGRVDFGPVRTDRWVDTPVQLRNLSASPLEVRLRLADSDPALSVREGAEVSLPPRGRVDVTVRFAPTEPRPIAGTLVLEGSCAGGCAATVPLTGRGVDASLLCAPDPLDFGFVNLETCGQARLTCTNVGPVEVSLAQLTLDPERGPFSADPPPLPASVAPGDTVQVGVAFCPSDRRAVEALITLDTLEPDVGPRRTTIPVLGQGGGPDIEVTPALLYFGGAIVGDRRTRAVRVRNRGFTPLSLTEIRVEPEGGVFAYGGPLPPPIPAGEAVDLPLVYTPDDFGADRATLVVASNDPDPDDVEVVLEGEGLGPGLCSARWSPEALEFGFVPVGAVVEATLELSAGGEGPCVWFDPRIDGHRAFSFATPPARRGLLPPGTSARFRIRYAPTEASDGVADRATMSVDVPYAGAEPIAAPLAGLADSSELVVFPTRVDLGATPPGVERRRSVFVYNAGLQDRALTDHGFARPVDGLRVLTPSSRRTLRPGEGAELRFAYLPTEPKSFEVPFEIRADGLPAPVRVPVRAEQGDLRCGGFVTGTICAPHGRWPSLDTTVSVTDRDRTQTVETDENGRFFVPCVTPGTARVDARRGHFRHSRVVSVTSGEVTALPADSCLEPPAASEVAVVTGLWDEIEAVLADAGVGHVAISGRATPPRLLRDADLLNLYDIVLLNCGFVDTEARDPAVQDNLRSFVLNGGSLYASDIAYDAIEGAFPELLELAGDDAVPDAAEVGQQPPFRATARAPALLRALGEASATMSLDLDYALVLGAAPGATVELVGESAGPGGGLRPLLVRYQPTATSGVVVFTLAHASARTVDPALQTVLEYAVFGL